MAHSIELLVDPATDAAVRRIWATLLDADLPSQGAHRSDSNRPHVTLIAAEAISADVDGVVSTVLADRLPITVEIGATLVFRGGRSTVALLVVASPELLSLHGDLVELARPFVVGDVFGHCESSRWTPHLTLARRVRDDQIGLCVSVADDARIDTPLVATITGIRRWDSDARRDVDLITASI